ncbi:MAG: hypothetical protein U1D96_04985 [Eubacteriales bacterium]|nr:hypothetical protein [Bacillota bacterium]MDP3051751.1 hypothetical protein [Eubacteriales bacterium]MDZ4042833.1 hypothetical protein [Eubacteriales bacterium]MDZ7610225.1 hypothetical protein [Eubacteriales bacterium]
MRYKVKSTNEEFGNNIDPNARHELGREIQIDYRGLRKLQAQKAKVKARNHDKMY